MIFGRLRNKDGRVFVLVKQLIVGYEVEEGDRLWKLEYKHFLSKIRRSETKMWPNRHEMSLISDNHCYMEKSIFKF